MVKKVAFILPILKLGLFCIIGPICRGFSTIVEEVEWQAFAICSAGRLRICDIEHSILIIDISLY